MSINLLIGFLLGIISFIIAKWYLLNKYGTNNGLGILMVYCRKSILTKWLVWSVWGDNDWYLDYLEKQIKDYQNKMREEKLDFYP